ncbi:MAG: HEAT repeat domain-containing protein [Candidatus Kariarchaeaceae archaeon]|jgi:HEAT repeat protein
MATQKEIDDVVDELNYGHPETRKAAAIKLGRIRDIQVIPHLIKAMQKDEYPWTRVSAIQSLTWIADRSIIEPLMNTALNDKDKLVRRTAIESLGSFKDPKALDVLNQIVENDPDYEIKQAASIAIQVIQGVTPEWSQNAAQPGDKRD